MPLRGRIALSSQAALFCRTLGFVVLAAAFCLPACKATVPISGVLEVHPGWRCALLTLGAIFDRGAYQSWNILAVLSGCLHPLLLVYLGFSFARGFVLVRRILAAAILACLGATCAFFGIAHLVPMAGFFLWMAGVLMVLLPEMTGHRPSRFAEEGQTPLPF
jgi:hypothetical protein